MSSQLKSPRNPFDFFAGFCSRAKAVLSEPASILGVKFGELDKVLEGDSNR
jgi:hypothetical protein